MPHYNLLHKREVDAKGEFVDLIVVPLGPEFGGLSENLQKVFKDELQERASRAEPRPLLGDVCLVWLESSAELGFLGPDHCRGYLRAMNMQFVLRHVNKWLAW